MNFWQILDISCCSAIVSEPERLSIWTAPAERSGDGAFVWRGAIVSSTRVRKRCRAPLATAIQNPAAIWSLSLSPGHLQKTISILQNWQSDAGQFAVICTLAAVG